MGEFPNKATQFKPGKSGNPEGMPKGIQHSKTRLLKLLSLVIKSKNEILGTEEEKEMLVIEKMDIGQIALAMSGDTRAYREIMDRLEGKSVETVNQKLEIDSTPKINIAIDGKDIDLTK